MIRKKKSIKKKNKQKMCTVTSNGYRKDEK